LDKGDCFKEGAIALEALNETTNADPDNVVMNSACHPPKFFEAQPTADSADEKSGLACTGAASRVYARGDLRPVLEPPAIFVISPEVARDLALSRAPSPQFVLHPHQIG
jgi:hypothetical protein